MYICRMKSPKEAHINIVKQARYFVVGTPNKQVTQLWIACHGYGQQVDHFASKFTSIQDDQTLILVPEGLSRFYFGGFTGHIGASWMTKADRLNEIEDYCNYLAQLQAKYIPQLATNVEVNLFGFSQGGATIMRYAFLRNPFFSKLVLWAADFPDDINYLEKLDQIKGKKLTYVYGTEDQFITPERIDKIKQFMASQNLHFDFIEFQGKHKIDRDVLVRLTK